MPDYSWILPVIAVVGVPLLVSWAKTAIEKGDRAQQAVLDRLERDVESIKRTLLGKSDTHQGEAVLAEIRSVGSKVEALNTLVLTELGKRPTREEMRDYCQTMHERHP